MSFAKLFSTITASSLWSEPKDVKILFVTMLASADSTGFVEASVPGLARLANLSNEETRAALENLESPDPDSKSQIADGRRIVKVNNGWALVNYEGYRNRRDDQRKRDYMRDYMREYRSKNSVNSVSPVNPSETNDLTTVPLTQPLNDVKKKGLQLAQAEAEAYAEAEGEPEDTETAYAPCTEGRVQRGKVSKGAPAKNSPQVSVARVQDGSGDPEPPAKRPDDGRADQRIPYGFANRVWEFWSICEVSDRQDEIGFFAKLAWAMQCGFEVGRPLMDIVGRAKRARSPAAQVSHVLKTEFPGAWDEFRSDYPTHTHCLWALEEIDLGRRKEGA